MKHRNNLALLALVAAAALALFGCGGGNATQTVSPSNSPPVIVSMTANPSTVSAGGKSTVSGVATDVDTPTLTYTWSASCGSFVSNGAIQVEWTAPSSSQTCTLTLTVSDGTNTATGTLTLTVEQSSTPSNNAPFISSGPTANPNSLQAGQASTISLTASDADNDSLTYTFSATDGILSPSTVTGSGTATVTYTAPSPSGTYTVSVTVSDSKGTSASGSVNVTVIPLAGKQVAMGYSHTCAVTTYGSVYCWGRNQYGELGNGTTAFSSSPVPVTGLSGITNLDTGLNHTCAVTSSGGVKCWGSDAVGQLGTGTRTNSATPVDVSGLSSGVTAIAVGGGYSCALTTSGGVKCWGAGFANAPVDVAGLSSGVSAIASGVYHACALTTSGGVKCWSSSTTPVDVTGLSSGVSAIAAGENHTCGITSFGNIQCWWGNDFGQLGNGTRTYSATPVNVSGLSSGVTAIGAGNYHTCAITASGGIKCWGRNDYGQLGIGTKQGPEMCPDPGTGCSATPVSVVGFGN